MECDTADLIVHGVCPLDESDDTRATPRPPAANQHLHRTIPDRAYIPTRPLHVRRRMGLAPCRILASSPWHIHLCLDTIYS